MVDILITHSYVLRLDPKQFRKRNPYPPLGTLQAAACLRLAGHSIVFHDVMHSKGSHNHLPKEFSSTLEMHRPSIVVIYDDGFNYLTKMCLLNMRHVAYAMMAEALRLGCKIIVASSDANDHAEEYLLAGADVVILGEAEVTLLEVVQAMQAATSLVDIPGTATMVDDAVCKGAKRKVMTNLNALPIPAWDLLHIAPYKKMWMSSEGSLSINIATTRGCPFKCNWCAKPIYGDRYTSRSPEHVADEIALVHQLFQPKHIWFCDDIFGLKPGWVERFSAVLTERKLRTSFTIQSRADLLNMPGTITALKSAGCTKVWLGAESGSQRILDAMDKGITIAQIRSAVQQLQSHNIQAALFLQFGYLGETRADINATISMVQALLPDDLGISISYPLPGTRYYESVRGKLGEKRNWTDSDDLLLMFEGAFRPDFYRRLHRYVHHDLRSRQGGFLAPAHGIAAAIARLRMRYQEHRS